MFGASHLDSMEIEKAKNVLKVLSTSLHEFIYHNHISVVGVNNYVMQEHEQALIDAIARLEDASDGESGN